MEPREPIRVAVDEDIMELIPGFLLNRRSDLTTIRQALDAEDWDTLLRLGHSMKGAGGGYGFDGISEIGAALEEAAKAEDAAGIQEGLRTLEDYLERVEVVAE